MDLGGGFDVGSLKVDGAASRLDLEKPVEFGLEQGEAAAEAGFLAMEVGERVGLEQPLISDGFEGDAVEAFEEFGEGLVVFAFDLHALQFDGDEAGFVRGDSAQAPGDIGIVVDNCDIFERFGIVALENGGLIGVVFVGTLGGQEWGFGGESMGGGVESGDGFTFRGAGSGGGEGNGCGGAHGVGVLIVAAK